MQDTDDSGIGSRGIPEKGAAFFEAVIFAACAGLVYAIAETYCMGIWGLRIGTLGVLTHGILFLVVAAILGSCFYVVQTLYGRVFLAKSGRSPGARISSSSLFAGAVLLGYVAIVAVWALQEMSAGKIACLALFVVASVIVLWLTKRGFISVAVALPPIVLLPFFASPMIASAEIWGELSIAVERVIFLAWAFAPASVLLVILIYVGRIKGGDATDSKGTEEARRLAVVVLAVFTVYLGVWVCGILPLNMEWSNVIDRKDVVLNNTQASSGGRPNVLIVVLDTVRADHLDLFGYGRKTMPRLTEFADQEGTVSAQIRAPAPSTLPTHGSLFTGMYPVKHGAHKPFLADDTPPIYAYPLRDGIKTMAERLQELGYRTGAISGNFGPLHPQYGLSRGFQYYDARPGARYWVSRFSWIYYGMRERSFASLLARLLPDWMVRRMPLVTPWEPPYRRAGEINGEILAWFERSPDDTRPFFLFINYFDAHDPYLPPGEYERLFERGAGKSPGWVGFPLELHNRLLKGDYSIQPEEKRQIEDRYDGELAYLDEKLGELMDRLGTDGHLDNTLVIILSDHGEGFGEHGFLRHSSTLYDTQVLVPLIIRFPKSLRGKVRDVPRDFQHQDVFPTIMELLGEDSPEDVQGCVWGEARDYAVSEAYVHYRRIPRLRRELRSIVRGRWKYVISSNGDEELYDMLADPQETDNLAQSNEAVVRELRRLMGEWDAENLVYAIPGTSGTEERAVNRLRSLGYIQ